MAQVVAGKTRVVVADVVDPVEVFFLRIGKDFFPANFQQRAQPPNPSGGIRRFDGRHRRRTPDACATQQAEKDGFGLVVAVMPEDEPIAVYAGKRGMAGDARGFFQSARMIAGNSDPETVQGDTAPATEVGAEILPSVRRRVEPVMNVRDLQHISETLPQGIEHIKQYG